MFENVLMGLELTSFLVKRVSITNKLMVGLFAVFFFEVFAFRT